MSGTDIYMRILLDAQDSASKVITNMATGAIAKISKIDPALGALGGIAVGVTAGLVSVGVVSVETAAKFQTAMLANQSHAGLAASQVQSVTDALYKMGPAVGQGPTQLATALYPVLSGLSSMTDQSAKSKVALVELNNAAKSVAGTTTSTNDVTFAMTSTYNAYGLATNNVALATSRLNMISDVMNATVSAGNMKWSDYSRMVGNFMAKASQAHIGITEANAALAVFTNSGESAQLAGTHLGALFLSMSANADTYAKRALKLHESFDVTKFKSLDLADKIKYLDKITGDDPGKVKAILGNQTLSVTFMKLHDHMSDYQQALKDLNHAQGATSDAFGIARQGFAFQLQQAQAGLETIATQIGMRLLPVLSDLMQRYVLPLIQNFINWASQGNNLRDMMQHVSDVISGMLGFLSSLVTNIGKLIGWFQQGSAPANAVKDALVGIGLALGVGKAITIASATLDFASSLKTLLPAVAADAGPLLLLAGALAAWYYVLADPQGQAALQEFGKEMQAQGADTTTGWDDFWGKFFQNVGDATKKLGNMFHPDPHNFLPDRGGMTDVQYQQYIQDLIMNNLHNSQVTNLKNTEINDDLMRQYHVKTYTGMYNDAVNYYQNMQYLIYSKSAQGLRDQQISDDRIKQYHYNSLNGMYADTQKYYDLMVQYADSKTPQPTPTSGPTLITGTRGHVPGFVSGIENFAGGLAYVHQRELLVNMAPGTSVIPAGRGGRSGGSVVNHNNFNITINSQATVTRQLVDEFEREIAQRFRSQTPGYSFGGVI